MSEFNGLSSCRCLHHGVDDLDAAVFSAQRVGCIFQLLFTETGMCSLMTGRENLGRMTSPSNNAFCGQCMMPRDISSSVSAEAVKAFDKLQHYPQHLMTDHSGRPARGTTGRVKL
jgi:hypothetical protein